MMLPERCQKVIDENGSPCKCDQMLHECLRSVHNITAMETGVWFYDAIGMKCYKKDYPVIRCKKRGGWFKSKCIEYVFNTTAERRYQWFDVPSYYTNP
ncbi:phospholipase A2-like [Papilio machaon]|uniref:phospholipase A2-like n=1 Tax=Papilio machaon TaxID=76193 RepID=UPI001E665D01|nr:phospholipase A2-like [Papilio machaon]